MQASLSPILVSARDILRELKNPKEGLHVRAIAGEAVRTNRNLGLSADDFSSKLSSALSQHLKLKTQRPIFVKPQNKKGAFKKGIYRLKIERPLHPSAKIEPPSVSSGFVGRAGEYAVMAELLFWGFNVSLMAVDNGIDIVANKNNRYFHIQVKTATSHDGGRYAFTIKKSAFEQNDNATTFYVFVMRDKASCDFAIFPSNYIQTLVSAGEIGNNTVFSLSITTDEKKRKFTLNGSTDINVFINNFGSIK